MTKLVDGKAVEIGVISTLSSTLKLVEVAKACDVAGFDRLGVSDTAPKLYHACYPAITAALIATKNLRIGPYVTNPVTRHWSVHAATAKSLDELASARFFIGMATGDGAVHSVGLSPAKLNELADYVQNMRGLMPVNVPVHMAFSGAKGVTLAGELADEITIGTGLDAGAITEMAARARAARVKAGIETSLKVWATAACYIADSEAEAEELRRSVAGLAVHGARFAFDFNFDGKNVPAPYQPVIRDRLKSYQFEYHGKIGDNPNGHLFDDCYEIQEYITNRFLVVGTQAQCAARLDTIIREAKLDGIWLMPAPRNEGTEAAISAVERLKQAVNPGH